MENITCFVLKQSYFLHGDENLFELAIYLVEKLSHNPNFTKFLKRLPHFTPSHGALKELYKRGEYKKLLNHMEDIKQKDLLIISRILHSMVQTGGMVINYTAFLDYVIFLQQHLDKHPKWCVKLLKSQKENTILTVEEI